MYYRSAPPINTKKTTQQELTKIKNNCIGKNKQQEFIAPYTEEGYNNMFKILAKNCMYPSKPIEQYVDAEQKEYYIITFSGVTISMEPRGKNSVSIQFSHHISAKLKTEIINNYFEKKGYKEITDTYGISIRYTKQICDAWVEFRAQNKIKTFNNWFNQHSKTTKKLFNNFRHYLIKTEGRCLQKNGGLGAT